MAAVSLSRRATAGIVFIIAGALLLLALILPLLGVTAAGVWLTLLAYLGIAVGLAILGFGAINGNVAKIMLIVAAVGWAILALALLIPAIPAILVQIAAIVAAVAGLIAAIVVYVGKEIKNTPALLFIITMVLALLVLLGYFGVALGDTLGLIIALAFGAALVITGVLLRQKERR
ncbi:MAG TPA: hypothetical protein VNR36_14410 [Pseudolysinimonas sp.]|nr:hypothetical protein [Pseudolysinimonas sp.]